MKRNILKLMAILMVALVSVSLVSCGDDDDDATVPSSLIGTWYGNYGSNYSLNFTFNSNKTGTGRITHNKIISIREYTFSYSYKSNGDVICNATLVWVDADETITSKRTLRFNLSGQTLTLVEGDGLPFNNAALSK